MISAPSGIDRQLPMAGTGGGPTLLRRLRRMLTPAGFIGLALVVFWVLIAAFGPMLAPHGVGAIVSYDVFEPMSGQHPLGTDYLGRDMLSRVLHGTRFTVGLALAAAFLASAGGTTLGLLAALSMSVQRHEAAFGVLETDVRKRVQIAK